MLDRVSKLVSKLELTIREWFGINDSFDLSKVESELSESDFT